jgi:hypothetical protein
MNHRRRGVFVPDENTAFGHLGTSLDTDQRRTECVGLLRITRMCCREESIKSDCKLRVLLTHDPLSRFGVGPRLHNSSLFDSEMSPSTRCKESKP